MTKKKGKPAPKKKKKKKKNTNKQTNKNGHFSLDLFWKQSFKGYLALGLDVNSVLAFPNPHGFWLSLGQLYETQLNW